jgi:hypothetical protein
MAGAWVNLPLRPTGSKLYSSRKYGKGSQAEVPGSLFVNDTGEVLD